MTVTRPVMRKVFQGAPANAVDNHHLNTLFAEPQGKGAGLMLRCRQQLGVQDGLDTGVHLSCAFSTTAEMPVQTSVLMGNG